MVGSRAALALVLGASIAACATSPAPSQPRVAVTSGSPQRSIVSDSPSPVAATATPSQPSPTKTPRPTPKPTPLAVPPPPSGATFKISYPTDTRNRLTVTWKGPRTKGTEIRVYGVTTCIAMPSSPAEGSQGPCLVEHTPLPPSVRKLLAKAPASTGTLSWTWPGWDDIGSSVAMSPDGISYEAIVIAAYNDAGHSKFIIIDPGNWCGYCTY